MDAGDAMPDDPQPDDALPDDAQPDEAQPVVNRDGVHRVHGVPVAPGLDGVEALIDAAGRGAVRALARVISMAEAGGTAAAGVAATLAGRPRAAWIVGVTGPPGVGKSTLTTALLRVYRARGLRVAVLAVDPSSPFSGGALLGDRVRMAEHSTDPGVFIRSMASRGHLGGLSAAAPSAVDALSALGYDVVVVETVGVGQNEIAVLRLADSVAVVLAPGMGDGVQAAKAGILEIADLLVVNKSDRDGAAATVRDLRGMLALGRAGSAAPGEWRVPVLSTVATGARAQDARGGGVPGGGVPGGGVPGDGAAGDGLPALVEQLDAHRAWLEHTGAGRERRQRRAELAVETLVSDALAAQLASDDGRAALRRAAARVGGGEADAHLAAADVLAWAAGRSVDRS